MGRPGENKEYRMTTDTRTQHTPPWHAVGIFVQDANGDGIASVYSQRTSKNGQFYKLTHDECVDIASLIAAAPDLLAALEAMMIAMDDIVGSVGRDDDWCADNVGALEHCETAYDQADAAIVKARGEDA